MKTIFYLLLAATTSIYALTAYAGPEEHRDAQKCYRNTELKPTYVPSEICLETLSVNANNDTITAYSYFMEQLFTNLKIDYLARRNENGFRFRSSALIHYDWPSCAFGELATLHIDSISDNDGVVDIAYLDIYVKTQQTPNTCNTQPNTKIYKYTLH
ncbi:MAG: hypothetical protein ACK41T_06685 [Pseudobdellovibrio sp.]